jgi:hypothetical protein
MSQQQSQNTERKTRSYNASDRRWNDRNRIVLSTLATNGLSASQIAVQIAGASRSAILNEASRLKISLAKRKPKTVKPNGSKTEKSEIAETSSIFPTSGIPLLTAEYDQCRWPCNSHGSDNMPQCCGRNVRQNSPYCEQHYAIAFVKPSKNKLLGKSNG